MGPGELGRVGSGARARMEKDGPVVPMAGALGSYWPAPHGVGGVGEWRVGHMRACGEQKGWDEGRLGRYGWGLAGLAQKWGPQQGEEAGAGGLKRKEGGSEGHLVRARSPRRWRQMHHPR